MEQEEDNCDSTRSLPFITTSDVLNQLNKNLKELTLPGEESLDPRFELQKRLPDGSTIPASQADLSASDLQNKLQQSAKFVSQLTPSDKLIWAEKQRLSGNSLFQRGEYKAAMDIYLTCLVVKETNNNNNNNSNNNSSSSKDNGIGFLSRTLLPVLNNLAQCTLQLGMHKKTIEFCKIALEEISKVQDHQDDPIDPIIICKIYYKRGKAKRLSGQYFEARDDLNQSLIQLEEKGKDDPDQIKPFHQAILKELRHLETAEKEGRKNKQRQKRAMQKALANTNTSTKDDATQTIKAPRQYSTIRARKKATVPIKNSVQKVEEASSNTPELSYWQYYWLVVERVAESLLIMLGDEETKEKLKEKVNE